MPSLMEGHVCPHPEAFRGLGEPCQVAHPGRYVCSECGKTHKIGRPWPHKLRTPKAHLPSYDENVLDLAWSEGITRAAARRILEST